MTARTDLYDALVGFYADPDLDLPGKVRPAPDGSDPEVGRDLVVVAATGIQPGTVVAGGSLLWALQVILVGQALEVTVVDPDDVAVTSPAEDHLEAALAQLLGFLDGLPWLIWTDAARSQWRDAFPSYAVTLTVLTPGD